MVKIIKRVCAPVRIDFAGGTTDISPFRDKYGGCVLNAAINKYIYGEIVADDNGTKLHYHGDIPTSSGLGTSSAMNVVWLALISKLCDKKEIAESVFRIEQDVSTSKFNGKQDMYASAFGGINFMEFKGDKVILNPLKLNPKIIKELEEKLVIVYSGIGHLSGNSNKAAISNIGKNNSNLLKIKEIAVSMRDFLKKGDLYGFAYLMNKETEERAKLSKIALSPQLKSIINSGLKNGAISAKILGSGGNGSVLFFAENPALLKRFFGKKVIDFKFDFDGLRFEKV